jgi:hypothetical protein
LQGALELFPMNNASASYPMNNANSSTPSPPYMHRVATVDLLCAEEGTHEPETRQSAQTQSRGWAAAGALTQFVSNYVQGTDAAAVRQDFVQHALQKKQQAVAAASHAVATATHFVESLDSYAADLVHSTSVRRATSEGSFSMNGV